MLCSVYGKEQVLAVGLGWDTGAAVQCSPAWKPPGNFCNSDVSLMTGGVSAASCADFQSCPSFYISRCQLSVPCEE